MEQESRKVGYYLERTTRIVKLRFTKQFKELGIDLTPEQWVILDNLNIDDGQSQIELAKLSFKDAPTVSRIIDLLVKKKLVERKKEETDRRIFQIFLTQKGKKLVSEITPTIERIRKETWNNLNDKDYQDFLRIVNQVFSNMDLDS